MPTSQVAEHSCRPVAALLVRWGAPASLATHAMDYGKLGNYDLLKLLAVDGMGEVFLARQNGAAGFTRTVVVKRLLPYLATDQTFVDMFLNEGRLSGLLSHPNIVSTIELGRDGPTWFIAMEYVPGSSVRGILKALARSFLAAGEQALRRGEVAAVIVRRWCGDPVRRCGEGAERCSVRTTERRSSERPSVRWTDRPASRARRFLTL